MVYIHIIYIYIGERQIVVYTHIIRERQIVVYIHIIYIYI